MAADDSNQGIYKQPQSGYPRCDMLDRRGASINGETVVVLLSVFALSAEGYGIIFITTDLH
jgi:hypothetical protein